MGVSNGGYDELAAVRQRLAEAEKSIERQRGHNKTLVAKLAALGISA